MEKPILFNTQMVQAILEGRKTVTRRVIKPKYIDSIFEMYEGRLCETEPKTTPIDLGNGRIQHKVRRFVECKQPYQVGDILYVRETWLKADDGIHYRANETPTSRELRESYGYKWKPSIHMPKEAARIFLKVTDVRVENLQDITEEQAYKEGTTLPSPRANYVNSFIPLWNSTIKKQDLDKYSWAANPWVWVIEFEKTY